MSDTVFILGAGFSYDAGIPLLSGFVEKMWEFAIRKTDGTKPLSAEDIKIFDEAMNIRYELDGYHGRAMFDDRNIEDILSILSFDTISGSRHGKHKVAAMNRAIARTIELCCTVKHPGIAANGNDAVNTEGSDLYRDFWKSIFNLMSANKKPPTIITFNYDLVLERSLHQILIGTTFNYKNKFPADGILLNYFHKGIGSTSLKITYCAFDSESSRVGGTQLQLSEEKIMSPILPINILKLHGSLNFPKLDGKSPIPFLENFTKPVDDPHILPPIFNKFTNGAPSGMWKEALSRLRNAKNIVIVGYGLPQTDIYMQYFLKAALGPNRDLNRIFVFDPELFKTGEKCDAMKRRYESCFSPQLRQRIIFEPKSPDIPIRDEDKGTTRHFVEIMDTLVF